MLIPVPAAQLLRREVGQGGCCHGAVAKGGVAKETVATGMVCSYALHVHSTSSPLPLWSGFNLNACSSEVTAEYMVPQHMQYTFHRSARRRERDIYIERKEERAREKREERREREQEKREKGGRKGCFVGVGGPSLPSTTK
jgi:hypothetical protein